VVLKLGARHHLAVNNRRVETLLFLCYNYKRYNQSMREQILNALIAHARGDIEKHRANVDVYLSNPAGVGEHTDILESIEKELDMMVKYQDQIDIINKYFKK
tara:strand:+ start:17 stop:322 length:306 start_codon:yes stop_codon:yes gene_type:complete